MIKPKNKCGECEHYILGFACKAFPVGGIPIGLLEGKETHDRLLDNQVGNYIFTRRKD